MPGESYSASEVNIRFRTLPGAGIVGNWDRAHNTMALDLLDAIERAREPARGARDGRWPVEMTAGIYQSQIKGARVAFPPADRRDPLASPRRVSELHHGVAQRDSLHWNIEFGGHALNGVHQAVHLRVGVRRRA